MLVCVSLPQLMQASRVRRQIVADRKPRTREGSASPTVSSHSACDVTFSSFHFKNLHNIYLCSRHISEFIH